MPTAVRNSRSQHNRLRRRAQALSGEVERLSLRTEGNLAPDLRVVPNPVDPSGFNIEGFIDRALDLTKGWEKIAALVALITTNLSGNKSLGALLEIMAKDKLVKDSGTAGDGQTGSSANATGLNISDLLGMAETILKTGQLPPAFANLQPPQAPESIGASEPVIEVIEPEITDITPEDEGIVEAVEADSEPEIEIIREGAGAFSDGSDS